jgi:hypothetical protein
MHVHPLDRFIVPHFPVIVKIFLTLDYQLQISHARILLMVRLLAHLLLERQHHCRQVTTAEAPTSIPRVAFACPINDYSTISLEAAVTQAGHSTPHF